MSNYTQRARAAIYTLLSALALSLTMTGWFARGLVKSVQAEPPLSAGYYQGCTEKLGDRSRALCASYSTPTYTERRD